MAATTNSGDLKNNLNKQLSNLHKQKDNKHKQIAHILEQQEEILRKRIPDSIKLPSAHQIDDNVELHFGTSGVINNCTVVKVHFSISKVLYDVEMHGNFDAWKDVADQEDVKKNNKWSTRLYNVDSVFVTAPVATPTAPLDNINQIYGIEMTIRSQKNMPWTHICVGSDYIYWEKENGNGEANPKTTYSPKILRRELERLSTLDLVHKITEVLDGDSTWGTSLV